jgi:hypothetical protein
VTASFTHRERGGNLPLRFPACSVCAKTLESSDHAQIIVVNDEHVAMWRFGSVKAQCCVGKFANPNDAFNNCHDPNEVD